MNNQKQLKQVGKFVIMIEQDGCDTTYYAIDSSSGGYPWFCTNVSHAEYFDSQVAAHKVLDNLVERSKPEHNSQYTDGTVAPATEIQFALQLNNNKQQATAVFSVCEVTVEKLKSVSISGAIKKPKGFLYV